MSDKPDLNSRRDFVKSALGMVDTSVGVAVGIVAAWLSLRTDAIWSLAKRRIDTAGPLHGQS